MLNLKRHIIVYSFSCIIFLSFGVLIELNENNFISLVNKLVIPSFLSFLLCILLILANKYYEKYITYIAITLFFSITYLTYFNYANTVNGFQHENKILLIYGLAFYTVFYANELIKNKLSFKSFFIASNPLLLITGPIAYKYKIVIQTKIFSRIKKYFPFLIIGIFFYKVIGSPLFAFMEIVEFTDPINTIIFGIIFEMIIYFNFAGISLIIYSSLGIVGLLIPLNFRQPFSSRNIIEYWKSWHVSLSRCLKSIFYNKIKFKSTYLAVFVVFISSAFWHGFALNFLIWGVFHASLFLVSLLLLKQSKIILPLIIAIFAIIFGRIIFADNDVSRLFDRLLLNYENISFKHYLTISLNAYISLILGFFYICLEFAMYKKNEIFKNYKFLRRPEVLILVLFLSILLIQSSGENYAVYNQR